MDKEAEELEAAARRVKETTAEVRACVDAGRAVPLELMRRLTAEAERLRMRLATATHGRWPE
jgi:hypothetical protein